jgi:hypothetical protein
MNINSEQLINKIGSDSFESNLLVCRNKKDYWFIIKNHDIVNELGESILHVIINKFSEQECLNMLELNNL